jgi:hypothetical protein
VRIRGEETSDTGIGPGRQRPPPGLPPPQTVAASPVMCFRWSCSAPAPGNLSSRDHPPDFLRGKRQKTCTRAGNRTRHWMNRSRKPRCPRRDLELQHRPGATFRDVNRQGPQHHGYGARLTQKSRFLVQFLLVLGRGRSEWPARRPSGRRHHPGRAAAPEHRLVDPHLVRRQLPGQGHHDRAGVEGADPRAPLQQLA